jgi:dihydroorotate dehydrogenase (NAD+) catalytic subunit
MKRTTYVDLSVRIGPLHFKNPTILASGLLGLDCATMYRVVKGGAAAVTMKSLTTLPRQGHNNPILVEFNGGFMNAVGYANRGIDAGVAEFKKWDNRAPLIGSIVAADAKEFASLAEKIQETPLSALEIVLSCPHTPGFGLLAGQGTPEATAVITQIVRKRTKLPLFVKLSPSIQAISDVAKAAEAEGADVINMGNTAGPGMKINIERARPILAFGVGGMSGPAILPLTIRCIWDLYKAVKIPIIATGGIMTGEDAIQAMMAGAVAVEIGTGIQYRGISVFFKVNQEISRWMATHGYTRVRDLKGKAHEV